MRKTEPCARRPAATRITGTRQELRAKSVPSRSREVRGFAVPAKRRLFQCTEAPTNGESCSGRCCGRRPSPCPALERVATAPWGRSPERHLLNRSTGGDPARSGVTVGRDRHLFMGALAQSGSAPQRRIRATVAGSRPVASRGGWVIPGHCAGSNPAGTPPPYPGAV